MGDSAMKSRRSARAALSIAAAAALPLVWAHRASANRYWVDGVTAGNWSNGSNWNASSATGAGGAGAPGSSDSVFIQNTQAHAYTITLDTSFSYTYGELVIADTNASGSDTLLQNTANDNLTFSLEAIGTGAAGATGIHTQSAGTNTYTNFLDVGDGGYGTYNLSNAGSIDVTGTGGSSQLGLYVGDSATGTFNQSGGTITLGSSSNTAPSLVLGNASGNGNYTMTGGAITNYGTQYVGYTGNGTFTQSAGTVTVGTNLAIGYGATANGTLNLGGTASLTVEGSGYIGGTSSAAGGNGTLSISGGSMSVSNTLKVWSTGTVNLNGGVLDAGTVDISSGAFSAGGGTLIVSGGQFILPTAGKTFGDGSTSSTLILHNGTVANGPLTVANHSTLAAAVANVPGRITASTNVNLQSGSILSLDLGAPTTPGTTFDQINQTGGTFFTGGATLSLTPIAGAVTGTTYPILVTNGGSINYTTPFSNLSGSGTSYTYTSGSTTANVTYVGSSSAGTAIDVTFTALPFIPNTAQTWGYNNYGQLGNGNTTTSANPVTPTGLNGGVTAVAAGGYHSLAIRGGGLYASGANAYGQLGNGSTTNSSTPVAVSGLSSGITAVAAGASHSLAIQNGGLYAWGENDSGQVGNGTTTSPSNPPFGITTPVAVTGLSSGVTAIAAGFFHSLAIQNGGLYAWGANYDGQLGNGSADDNAHSTPVAISSLSSGVTAVAAGDEHSVAIQNGGLYAWGDNSYGELGLGNGNTAQQNSPAVVFAQGSGVTAVAAGYDFTLAVKGGDVYAWGKNGSGQLGNGSADGYAHSTPVEVDAMQLTSIIAVAAGYDSSYALSSDGSLWVWGDNSYGELGLGSSTTQFDLPQHLLPPAGEVYTAIDAGEDGYHAIAILAPEPSSLTLLALGGVMLLRRRRRR